MKELKDVYKWEEGKTTYGAKTTNPIQKKQLTYPVKDLQATVSETIEQTGFGLNKYTLALTMSKLDDFTRDSIISHEGGFLRNGYIQRKTGKIVPQWADEYPEPKKPVTITAAYPVPMLDDYTGAQMGQLQTKHDIIKLQNRQAFLDPSDYEQYLSDIANLVSESTATAYKVASKAFLMATWPGVTLTEDINIVPFLDETVVPDEATHPAAKDGFKKDSKFWAIVKKEIIAQTQYKFKNVGTYSVALHNPFSTGQEINAQPTDITCKEGDKEFKKRYMKKSNNKFLLKTECNRFVTLMAMTRFAKEKLVQMTQIDTPTNLAAFDPTCAQKDLGQLSGHVNMDQLCIVFNPFDWAEITEGTTSTSQRGNYSIHTFASEIAQGLTVYVSDAIMPCDFKIIQKGMFKINNILSQYYSENMEWVLAKQDGHFDFSIPMVLGFGVGFHGIAQDAVPSQHYLNQHFKSLQPES